MCLPTCIVTLFGRFSRPTRRTRVYRLSWTNRSHRCNWIPRSYRYSGITWRTWLYGISWRSRLDRTSWMDRRSRYVICVACAFIIYFCCFLSCSRITQYRTVSKCCSQHHICLFWFFGFRLNFSRIFIVWFLLIPTPSLSCHSFASHCHCRHS